ncbi:34201_t:CDS:2, partial [Racocetra persica]
MMKIFNCETFTTGRLVTIPSRWGILHRMLQVAIIIYLIYSIIMSELYLKKELPVPGAVRTTLKESNNVSTPSYCTGTVPCVFWSANE